MRIYSFGKTFSKINLPFSSAAVLPTQAESLLFRRMIEAPIAREFVSSVIFPFTKKGLRKTVRYQKKENYNLKYFHSTLSHQLLKYHPLVPNSPSIRSFFSAEYFLVPSSSLFGSLLIDPGVFCI